MAEVMNSLFNKPYRKRILIFFNKIDDQRPDDITQRYPDKDWKNREMAEHTPGIALLIIIFSHFLSFPYFGIQTAQSKTVHDW